MSKIEYKIVISQEDYESLLACKEFVDEKMPSERCIVKVSSINCMGYTLHLARTIDPTIKEMMENITARHEELKNFEAELFKKESELEVKYSKIPTWVKVIFGVK